jgi:hypothetical protein
MPSTTVWNSQFVQLSLEKLRMNIQTDLSCFYRGDLELKDGNILFQLTSEEIDEFHKCSGDVVYFVEKYCRFLTDTGRRTVALREKQKLILRSLAEESYSEKFQELIPTIRNIIMMQARQSGKCLFNSEILIQYPSGEIYKVPINIFYYMIKGKLTCLEKIKVNLMILYYKMK